MTFKTTALYIKTHNVTGKKYFGKTTLLDQIHSYTGSGKYWKRHLRVHGKDYTTELVGIYHTPERLTEFALKFSAENDIVKSDLWLNLGVENGLDGGDRGVGYNFTGHTHTAEARRKMSEASKAAWTRGAYTGLNIQFGSENPQFKGAVIATNIKDGSTLRLCGAKEQTAAGFCTGHISRCLSGERKQHKGYTFTRE